MISGEEGWISLGPWGGEGGVYSIYKAEGPIIQITIRYGDVIDSILFESKSYNGDVIGSSVKIGGTGGGALAKFCIDSSVEQLSSISLAYKDYYGHVVIKSLCFETNIGNKYGPFGLESGAFSVSIPIEGRLIAGFHGRGGSFLDAFGIFVAPKRNHGGAQVYIVHTRQSEPVTTSIAPRVGLPLPQGWMRSTRIGNAIFWSHPTGSSAASYGSILWEW